MRPKNAIEPEWATALLGGSVITLGLFLLLSAVNNVGEEPPSVITVEFLQSSPQPHEGKTPAKKRSHPRRNATPLPQPVPRPERQLQRQKKEEAPDENDSNEESLPTPVPIFRLTAMPRFIHRQTPEYPAAMKEQGREGTVSLAVLVDAQGRIRQITILQSAGEEFDHAAVAALKGSSFKPGSVDSRAVAVVMKIPVRFKLR